MTVQLIPFFPEPSWDMNLTLEGTSYVFQADFNERCGAWYVSLADADGVDIVNGIKLITGPSLWQKCKDPRKPPGALFVVSSTSSLDPPGIDDMLSGQYSLLYITSDWLAAIDAGNVDQLLALLDAGAENSGTSSYGQGT